MKKSKEDIKKTWDKFCKEFNTENDPKLKIIQDFLYKTIVDAPQLNLDSINPLNGPIIELQGMKEAQEFYDKHHHEWENSKLKQIYGPGDDDKN